MTTKVLEHLPPHQRVLCAADNWQKLGDSYVANVAKSGLRLDWLEGFCPENPHPLFRPAWWVSSPLLPPQVGEIVEDWLRQGVITEIESTAAKSCSSIFVIPKKGSDDFRLITNLKNVNAFLSTTPFRLPTLQSILPFLSKGMYACKIDLKNAYLHWPISERDKKFLVFEYQGRYFQHESLPFGLSVAPREWQRAMEAIVKVLRREGATIWVYLDDFLLLGCAKKEVAHYTQLLLQTLEDLGIEVNYEKSETQPVQVLQYLGFILDLLEGHILIPPQKLSTTLQDLARFSKKAAAPLRQVSSILGRVRSLLFALPQAKLLTDQMVTLLQNNPNTTWDTMVTLSSNLRDQIENTIHELKVWKGRNFVQKLPQTRVFSDASDQGWGATADLHPHNPAFGWFNGPRAQHHINIKEGQAALQALLVYNLRDTHVHLYTDNTTLWWYLHKWGGRSQEMNKVVKKIWDVSQERNLTITPHYIPSLENPADQPSRVAPNPLSLSSLHPTVMQDIEKIFTDPARGYSPKPFRPKWDWMACPENAVCKLWVGEEENFFLQDLGRISPGWLNPPHHMVPQVLNYLAGFTPQAQALSVMPFKPHSPWWPLWSRMKQGNALIIYNHQKIFVSLEGQPLSGRPVPLAVAVLQGLNHPNKRHKSH